MTEDRDYYKVLILSQSGKGKTFSARNLDPNSTGFINVENKPLPFKGGFKYHGKPKKYSGALQALKDYSANPEIQTIFIDSFSAYSDLLLEEMREKYKGFDIWSNYNMKIGEFLKLIKLAEKEVFVTGHYESLNIEGSPEKRAKVKAKEWEGVIEKEFTVVLYADSKFKDNKNEYYFVTQGDGLSAKVPPDLLENQIKIPNDCREILEKIQRFAGVTTM
jgi:hypothetical protein